ncbi:16S rRNA (cytidine(1402)-2'-O)-methyltransferase [Dyadobacter fermentans]|uniref:Ribosomal RNA small subunit methyltransferase I n=1 Tax=Dyadobacter fermentans (strain ATCC 700827 / DSM 18053 / CIP 107007 / KCTC 52180 / NS114) TaxID=471854 RepID=C6W7K5_DYAFD|nr:16S rRNA (cytidine(1402)-2'-O)-methyltransferase [Dyadobacter fermentans]ACT96199.1 Uroporphyrin-III C/tetrapyrrole (Corrin/Porphyrin) methyltransferase [Dyadobacter fermentans DSM 18053]
MKLYIVPTPIGNLEDITLRAINVLKSVDVVLAEDTRTSGNLLKHLGISKPLQSYHIHNEHQTVARVVERIRKGETMALVSDAGTPAVSDPGFLLVRACIREGLPVECLPGPTAFVPALVNSGLPSDRFTFEGFLPHKKGRQTRLQNLANEERTMIFYESPHRLVKALQQFAEYFGADRQVCVSRELSKMFEENVRGTVTEVIAHFGEKAVKGEIVIVVAGKADEKRKSDEEDED